MLDFAIAQESFWRDEAFSMLIAIRQPLDIIITMAKDQSPPLYFLLLHYWILIAGVSEAHVRLLSLIFHIASGLVFFLLSRKILQSLWAQIIATGAFLCNPFLLQYAYEARPYSLLVLLTLVSAWCLSRRWNFLAGIALSLAILTHNFALFSLVSIGLWWGIKYRKDLQHHIHEALQIFLLPIITVIAWGSMVIQQIQRVSGDFWITEDTPAMFKQFIEVFFKGSIWHKNNEALFFFAFVLFVAGCAAYFKKRNILPLFVSLSLFLSIIPITITYFVSYLDTPIYHERYLISTVPFIILALAYGLTELCKEAVWTKVFVAIAIFLYACNLHLSDTQILNATTKPAINWGVAQALAAAKPGDILVSEGYINYLETKWYSLHNAKGIKAYTVTKNGNVPYYIGTSVFDRGDILATNPKGKTIWIIQIDGGYHRVISK